MNENPQVHVTSRGTGASAAMGFLVGAVVGAGIALLLAPRTGREARRHLTDAGRRWGGAARSTIDQVRDTAIDLKQDAKSALKAGREAFEHGQKAHDPASRTEPKG